MHMLYIISTLQISWVTVNSEMCYGKIVQICIPDGIVYIMYIYRVN